MSNLDSTLIALADPTRRQVVNLLRQGPRSAGELAHASNMSAPAMSRHLRVLRRTKLVEESAVDHDARIRIYRLQREPLVELQAWLREIESFWNDELGAFKAHAERQRKVSKK
jgi:DNA-binding transcriptional ArsR family regulator